MAKAAAEKTIKKSSPAKKSKKREAELSTEIREEQVRLAAYYRWEAKGKHHGTEADDWLEAEDSMTD